MARSSSPKAQREIRRLTTCTNGGPLFVDALATRLGAEVFSRFLRGYYESNKWQIATTVIFMSEAEAACSCDLDALFDQWVLP